MSFVVAGPESLAAAASDLAGIGTALDEASARSAQTTTEVVAAASDQVSDLTAELFSAHGRSYQQLGAELAALHRAFVQNLTATEQAFARTEATAAASLLAGTPALAGAVQQVMAGPAAALTHALGGPATAWSGAAHQFQSLLTAPGGGPISRLFADSLLRGQPTAGSAVAAAMGNAHPAAGTGGLAEAIENAYNAIEPRVQYAFRLVSWAAGWVFFPIGPQVMFVYNLIEPMVRAGLFNTANWLSGSISFSQGWSNFWSATNASVDQFITSQVDWVRGLLPPAPPGINF